MEDSEVGSEEDVGGGFEELERFLPKGGGCRMLEDYSEPKAGARVLYRSPSGARGWLVGTLGRRTTDRAGTGTWCSRRWTLEEGWLAQCQQRYAGTTMVLEATGWLSRRGLHQGE